MDEASPQLLAVCVGRPRTVDWRGESVRTGIFKQPVAGRVAVGPLGLEGDGQADLSVHGGPDKAVYAYDASNAAWWQQELGRSELAAGVFGENLTVRGADERRVRIGDVLRIGRVRLEVSQPRQPCFKLGLRLEDPKFPKRFFASGRVGYYLRVLESGDLGAGDPIELSSPDADAPTVRELVSVWLDRKAPREAIERALAVPALARAWREPLAERLSRGR